MVIDMAALDIEDDDVITFAHCKVSQDEVRDAITGEVLALNTLGVELVRLCDGERSWRAVLDQVCAAHTLPREQASTDVFAFVTAAERRSLVRIKRSWRARLRPASVRTRIYDLVVLSPRRLERRRYRATYANLALATVRALRLPLCLGVASAPFVATGLVMQSVEPLRVVLATVMPVLLTVFIGLSILAHELGHLLVMLPSDRDRASVVCDNLAVAVDHPSAAGSQTTTVGGDRVVALVGPAFGMLVGLVPAAALFVLQVPPAGVAGIPALVGLAHLASLAPWAHDGRVLWARPRPGIAS